MNAILHFFGICGDSHTHIDIIDIFIIIAGGSVSYLSIKLYIKTLIIFVKNFFKKGFYIKDK